MIDIIKRSYDIGLEFDEINVIQTIFLVIKCLLKFASLMGYPVFCTKAWSYLRIGGTAS